MTINCVARKAMDLDGLNDSATRRTGHIRPYLFDSRPKALFESSIMTVGRSFDGELLFSGVTLTHLSPR